MIVLLSIFPQAASLTIANYSSTFTSHPKGKLKKGRYIIGIA